jgi:hypothetical protein
VRAAFGKMESLKECWLGEKRVARRCGDESGGLRWMWERKSEELEDCAMDGHALAKFWMEKEAVVVRSEMGS